MSFFGFIDVSDYVVCLQTPDDPMHMVNLGLWVHLLQAIFYDLDEFLSKAKRRTRDGREGNSYFGTGKKEKVWDRYVPCLKLSFIVFACLIIGYGCQKLTF